MNLKTLEQRVVRLEHTRSKKDPSDFSELSDEELNDKIKEISLAILDHPEASDEDKRHSERVLAKLAELERQAAKFWARPDIAAGVRANQKAGRVPLDWVAPKHRPHSGRWEDADFEIEGTER